MPSPSIYRLLFNATPCLTPFKINIIMSYSLAIIVGGLYFLSKPFIMSKFSESILILDPFDQTVSVLQITFRLHPKWYHSDIEASSIPRHRFFIVLPVKHRQTTGTTQYHRHRFLSDFSEKIKTMHAKSHWSEVVPVYTNKKHPRRFRGKGAQKSAWAHNISITQYGKFGDTHVHVLYICIYTDVLTHWEKLTWEKHSQTANSLMGDTLTATAH